MNRIVRERYPVSKLPQDLREAQTTPEARGGRWTDAALGHLKSS